MQTQTHSSKKSVSPKKIVKPVKMAKPMLTAKPIALPLVTGATSGILASGALTGALYGAKSLGWIGATEPEKVLHKVVRRGQLMAKSDGSPMNWVTRLAVGAALGMAIALVRRELA